MKIMGLVGHFEPWEQQQSGELDMYGWTGRSRAGEIIISHSEGGLHQQLTGVGAESSNMTKAKAFLFKWLLY